MLVDPDNVRPKLLLQAVPEAKAVKNLHLDIDSPDVGSEASRLESLGARRREAAFAVSTERTG